MPVLTERNKLIQARWGAFLTPLVGKGRSVSVARLFEEARDVDSDGDWRPEIYAYLKGSQGPGPARAFLIGEALGNLRPDGVPWSSGPLALAAAGRFDAFVCCLAGLVADGCGVVAMALALLTEFAIDEDGSSVGRDQAREILSAIPPGKLYDEHVLRSSDRAFRFAHIIASEESTHPQEVWRGIVMQITDFGLHRASHEVREATGRFSDARDSLLRVRLLHATPQTDAVRTKLPQQHPPDVRVGWADAAPTIVRRKGNIK